MLGAQPGSGEVQATRINERTHTKWKCKETKKADSNKYK